MTDKLVRAWSDSDLNLPTVHLDAAVPATDPADSDTAEFGFTFADEWEGGKRKRSLDDKPGDRYHDATHKRDNFLQSDDVPAGESGGLTRADGPPRKRDPIDPLDSGSLLEPVDRLSERLSHKSSSDPPSKGWYFVDAGHRKRQDTESAPDSGFPRPRHGWLWKSAPHKRDEEYDACVDTHDSSLIFKDTPFDFNCGPGFWARMKKAVRSILP